MRDHKKKASKKHLFEFNKIIEALEETAEILMEDNPDLTEVTEQWVKENAPEVLGRELDSMEVIVVASRMWHLMESNEKEDKA